MAVNGIQNDSDVSRWYNPAREEAFMGRHASLKPSKGKPFRQLNASLPVQLVNELNAYARSQGRFRDATLEMMIRAALKEAGGAEWRAQSRTTKNSVVFSFAFPEPVRAACSQYLLYFSEFLRDIGVNVTAQLSEGPASVLFSVTPVDKAVALKNVEEALRIYLALAQLPVKQPDSTAPLPERKLAETLSHLHKQLGLAKVITSSQRLGIQDQAEIIEVQRRLLSERSMRAKQGEEDREELFGGSVALTVFKWQGIEISLAAILRRVKRLFRRKTA